MTKPEANDPLDRDDAVTGDAATGDAPTPADGIDELIAEAVAAGSTQTAGPAEAGVPDLAAAAAEDPRTREELLGAVWAAEAERANYLDRLQRLQAEFDNFRKRSMREGASQREAGVADLAGKLLDVLDDFDMAMLSVDKTSDVEALHKGLELVYAKMISTLKSVGLERIDDQGAVFDPERHDAVQQVAAEEPVEHPVVADVLRAGYSLRGKVLRPAMVKVAQ